EAKTAISGNARRVREADRLLIEAGGTAFRYRHRRQSAVGIEAPAVIAAGEPGCAPFALVHHFGAAMGAAVEQHVDAAVTVANHDDGLVPQFGRDVVAGLRHLAHMADAQPGAGENAA